MVTEKKPAAPGASDKTGSATANAAVAGKPDSVKSPEKISTKSRDKKAPNNKTLKNKTPKKPLPWFKTILLLLLIVALAGSLWFGWIQWQQRMTTEDQLQRSLAALEDKVERQQQTLLKARQGQSTEIDQLQKQLYSLRLVANRQAEQILTLGSATRGDWLLAEAA